MRSASSARTGSVASRVLSVVVLGLAVPAVAQERPFGQRELRVSVVAGQAFHREPGQGWGEFVSPVVQWGRFLSRRVEPLVELHPLMLVNQPRFPPDGERELVEAVALDVGIRWYFSPESWTPKLYVEVLEGAFYSLRPVPARGTSFNFLSQAGAGVRLPFGDRWQPFVQYRWVHISNAGTGHYNPDWDFHGLMIGGSLVLPD